MEFYFQKPMVVFCCGTSKGKVIETSSFEFSLVTVVVSLGFVHFFTGLLLFFLTGHMTTSARFWLAMNYLQTVFPALITQPTNTDNIQLLKETLHMYKTGRFLILFYDILHLNILYNVQKTNTYMKK